MEVNHSNNHSMKEATMMMNQDPKTVGSLFKQRRQEMNLSLKEAENATSVRISYLQAIEEGNLGRKISPVYAQGFVKQYAIFLGIDGEKILKQHPDLFGKPKGQEFDYGIGTLEVRGHPGSGVSWLPNAVWIGAFAVVFFLAWYFAHYLGVL